MMDHTTSSAERKSENRRRENRLGFQALCQLAIKGPTWALMQGMLEGRTENLTEHGVKVILPDFPLSRFERWRSRIEEGEYLQIELRVGHNDEVMSLPGQVVWADFVPNTPQLAGAADTGPGSAGECSLGVLLSIMDQNTVRTLRRVLLRIETNQSTGGV